MNSLPTAKSEQRKTHRVQIANALIEQSQPSQFKISGFRAVDRQLVPNVDFVLPRSALTVSGRGYVRMAHDSTNVECGLSVFVKHHGFRG
jgi:hypothetical protein